MMRPTKGPIATYILDLLNLILHNMYFEFNDEFFLQIGGTAMGTELAPNYANLFMDMFENKALDNYPLKPLIWKRFIDDIFLIWTHIAMGSLQVEETSAYCTVNHQASASNYQLSNMKHPA